MDPSSAINIYTLWMYLLGYMGLTRTEVVYLCFDSTSSSVDISCADDKRIKVVESLYVRSQWDACFYQYGAGDCSQKTNIGFDCCGESSCKVEAVKAYLPACGYSTLLRVVYECVSESYSALCGNLALNDDSEVLHTYTGKASTNLSNNKWAGGTTADEIDVTPKDNQNQDSRHGLKKRMNLHRQKKVNRDRKQWSPGSKPVRPRRGGPQSSNRTAYGLLGSGIIIIVGLSGLLAFLWWRRRQLSKPTRFVPPSVTPDATDSAETELKESPTSGNSNMGYESDIMVSVLPEAPPRSKRKRHFPSFLGIKDSRESKRRGPPAVDSLQDYDGESLSDSGTDVPTNQRRRGLTRPKSDLRPDDYSHDMERLQRNFVTREAKLRPTTEI